MKNSPGKKKVTAADIPLECSTPNALANLFRLERDLRSYCNAFEAVLKSDQSDLIEELFIYTYRLHKLPIPGFAFTLIRYMLSDEAISVPYLARELCDPEYTWSVAHADFDAAEAFFATHNETDSRLHILVDIVLKSLVAQSPRELTFDLLPDQRWSDREVTLATVVAIRSGKCDLGALKYLADRGPVYEAVAFACSVYCGNDGVELIRENKSRVPDSMGLEQLKWFLIGVARMNIARIFTSGEYMHLLTHVPDSVIGKLFQSVCGVDRITVEMLTTIALRAEEEWLHSSCAIALKSICQRAEELGKTVTLPSRCVRNLSFVIG